MDRQLNDDVYDGFPIWMLSLISEKLLHLILGDEFNLFDTAELLNECRLSV